MQIKLSIVILLLVVIVNAQKGAKRPKPSSGYESLPSPAERQNTKSQSRPASRPQQPQYDEEGYSSNSLDENKEESGPEPPAVVPQTSFTCDDKPYNPGMYADMEVDCSVYHMCYNGRKESFLCGTGTMFNQEILSCDHPEKVRCSDSPNFYEANTELGKPGAEPSNDVSFKTGPAPASGPAARPPQRQNPRQNQGPSIPRPSNGQKPGSQSRAPNGSRQSKTSLPKPVPNFYENESDEADEGDDGSTDNSEINSGYAQPSKSYAKPQSRPQAKPQPRLQPRPQSKPQFRPQPKPSKTNNKLGPKRPAVQPKKQIEQSYVESEPEDRKTKRAYNARY